MESAAVARTVTPTEVCAVTATPRDAPGVAREPGPIRCLCAVPGAAGGRSEATDAETHAVRVAEGMHVSARDRDALGRAGHRAAACGAVQPPAGADVGAIIRGEVGARDGYVPRIQTSGYRMAVHRRIEIFAVKAQRTQRRRAYCCERPRRLYVPVQQWKRKECMI